MKGVVAYDSVHGNTKQVAEAIADQIRSEGHEAELINLHGGGKKEASGDFMFIGSPTRGGRATKVSREFIDNLDAGQWKNKPIVLFDTVGPLSKDEEKRKKWLDTIDKGSKNAASQMQELCEKRGLSVHSKPLHVAVTGFMGPLASDSLDRSKDFTHHFLSTLK